MSNRKDHLKNNYDVIVVGAGAAGLMAAIWAGRSGCRVLVLEHASSPAKKLLMTGNGKCNFTNEALNVALNETSKSLQGETIREYYHGACPAFVLPALTFFDVGKTLDFFRELGVEPVCRRGGYYPASGQASSVRLALLMECDRLDIKILCDIGIRSIEKYENGFLLDTKSGAFRAAACVLATGGKSYRKTGSDGSGFLYVERLGHGIQDVVPALVPLQSSLAFFKKVAGIRAEISTGFYRNEELLGQESGELQLTDYGLSGICIFQLSHLFHVCKKSDRIHMTLDFLPTYSDTEASALLDGRMHHPCAQKKNMGESLIGLLPDRLGLALLDEAGIDAAMPCHDISEQEAERLLAVLKHFDVPITGTRSFEQAQVSAGGVDTCEVNATMESLLISGLFFAGEMLDVDGICGGFNLQWAWSSGALSGHNAARYVKELDKCIKHTSA
jgi:hypothetical protein